MPIVQGLTGNWSVMPAALFGFGAPSDTVQGVPGQTYIDRSTDPYTLYIFNGAEWDSGVSGTGAFTTLTASGAVDFADTLNVDGAVTFGDTLDVTGAATLSSTLSAGATTLASVGVTGAATVGTTLGVTGVSTLTGGASVGTGLVVTAGGADITGEVILSGDLRFTGVDDQIQMNGGAVTSFIGTTTLVAGTVTIANTSIAAADRILLSRASPGASTEAGSLSYTITPATSFTITSLDPSDASTATGDISDISYVIVRQV